jgi:hypothetical protein
MNIFELFGWGLLFIVGFSSGYLISQTYSKGSCGELRTRLMIHREVCRELAVEPFSNTDAMIEETREIYRMLSGFIGHLKAPSSLSLDS